MNKIVLISILYTLILVAAALLPEGIGNYNAYVLLMMSVMYLLLVRSPEVYMDTILCGGMVFAVSIFRYPLYACIDSALVFFIFSSLYAGACFKVDMRNMRMIRWSYLLVIFLLIAGMLKPTLWNGDDMRYVGIFHRGNTSASVFLMLVITVWEIEKIGKNRILVLLLLVAAYLLYIWASGTRSLLFGLPYWLYQLFSRQGTRIIVVLMLVAGVFYLPMVAESIVEKVRLEEDPSMRTRSSLYLLLLSGIWDNYALIPQGSHAGWYMVKDFTGDPSFSPHNDFLNFIYEWGVIFYIFCTILVMRLKRFVQLNLEFLLILLALSSCALHNTLFNVIIWIPFTVILMVRRTVVKGVAK